MKVIWCFFFVTYLQCVFVNVLRNMLPICFSFSGPAHILCLTVASG